MKRKTPLVTGEYYHIFNRGVDKRQVFMDKQDFERFLKSMIEFNVAEPVGGLYMNTFKDRQLRSLASESKRLVDFIAYCINPNHFHFVLRQISDEGVSKFLHRLGTGYTKYFNERYKRTGSLFQGTFKSVHIENNEQLLHVSVYVNLNNKVHKKFDNEVDFTVQSSWKEYTADGFGGLCKKDAILGQFKNKAEYKSFAEDTILGIAARRRKKEEEGVGLEGVFGGV